jgi:hypothetical protein
MNRSLHILVYVLVISAAGCGFHSSPNSNGWHWDTTYRQDIHTVAVPIFTTRDYHRGVEMQLSDALVKKIEEFTPYKVVPRERADTILEGEIVSIHPSTLVLDPQTATPQQELYTISVNFTWKDLHTGKILVSRTDFEQDSTYFPTLGEDQVVGSQDAVERLAMGIVQEMEGAW